MSRGVSTLVATALLVIIVLSIAGICYNRWASVITMTGGSISSIMDKEAMALGKKLALIYVNSNGSFLEVFLYNYGWREIKISKIFHDSVEIEPNVLIWDPELERWQEARVIKKGDIFKLLLPGQNLGKLEIVDSSGVILRIYGG